MKQSQLFVFKFSPSTVFLLPERRTLEWLHKSRSRCSFISVWQLQRWLRKVTMETQELQRWRRRWMLDSYIFISVITSVQFWHKKRLRNKVVRFESVAVHHCDRSGRAGAARDGCCTYNGRLCVGSWCIDEKNIELDFTNLATRKAWAQVQEESSCSRARLRCDEWSPDHANDDSYTCNHGRLILMTSCFL